MIKRNYFLFVFLSFIIILVSLPARGHAALDKGPAQKFARGLAYIVASPFQIPKEMIQKAADADPVYLVAWKAVAEGAGSGLYHMGRQGIAGFWDLFTFWTPAGRDWAPLFEPSSLFPEV